MSPELGQQKIKVARSIVYFLGRLTRFKYECLNKPMKRYASGIK